MNVSEILQQCMLHGDMYVLAFGRGTSSAIIQTELCKYAFGVCCGWSDGVRLSARAQPLTETHAIAKYKSPHLQHSKSRYEAQYVLVLVKYAL